MNPTVTIGRIAGVKVGVNWSWLVVFGLIAWSLAAGVFPEQEPGLAGVTYAAMGVAATLLFFASLTLHELGHALQARRDGVEIEDITLWLFGGVARFRGSLPSAGAELRIALAGPFVTAVLGGLFEALAFAAGGGVFGAVTAWLGYMNLLLLAFNMLPALPLDGGRVFRSLLWRRSGDFPSATALAARVGRGFGYGLVALGLLLFAISAWSAIWLALIGWFLLQAAAAEGREGVVRKALGDLRVGDLAVHAPLTADADSTLAAFLDAVSGTHRFTTYPVVDRDEVVGLLPFAAAARLPAAARETTLVRDVMIPFELAPRLREEEPLVEAVGELATVPPGRALVVSNGRVVGLLSITDVGRLVAASGRISGRPDAANVPGGDGEPDRR